MHRYLLIIPSLLAFVSPVAVAQQKPKSIHSLPVEQARPSPVEPIPPAAASEAAPSEALPGQNTDQGGPQSSPKSFPNGGSGEEIIPKMEFPNEDVKAVLSFYERLTGARIVYDNTVQGTVNIVITSPVTQREAIQIIETNLLLNGFSLIPGSDNIIKVIGLTKNPRSSGVPIFSDLAMLPDNDRVVTFIFKLKYSDPAELIQMLQAGYIAPSIYTALTALPKSQSIMVTESTPVIRGLAKIIQQIDIPPAEVVSEFIPLERAEAKDVLEKLEKVFEKPQSQGGAGASVRANAPAPNTPPAAGAVPAQEGASIDIQGGSSLSEDSIIVGKIKLTADIRTNRIHVITRPINLPFVRKLIHDFDSNVPFAEPAKRALRYVSADDVLDIVVKAITEPGMKAEESGGSKSGSQKSSPAQPSSFGGSSGGYMGGGMSGGMGSGGMSEELATAPVDITPKAVTVGSTKIIADPRENTILVLGNKEVRSKVFALLDQIDVRAPQVMLNTVIGELAVDETTQLGIDYILHSGGLLTGGSNNVLPASGKGFGGSNFGNYSLVSALTQGLGSSNGIAAVFGLGNSLDIVVNALQKTGRFRVVQRPMVFTSNNKKAIIASGEEIAIPTQTQSYLGGSGGLTNIGSNPGLTSNVQYKPVELKLEVVPLINSDREVSLDIVQTLNSVSNSTDTVQGSTIPRINTRYIKTNVSVPNRATVALGGLIKRENRNNNSGIPVLSKIPLVGYLFRNTDKGNTRTELIILIRPVVSNQPADTMSNSEIEQQRMLIEPDLESTLNNAGPTPIKPAKSVPFRTLLK